MALMSSHGLDSIIRGVFCGPILLFAFLLFHRSVSSFSSVVLFLVSSANSKKRALADLRDGVGGMIVCKRQTSDLQDCAWTTSASK